jgi:transposase-like protein
MEPRFTLLEVIAYFRNFDNCRNFMIELLWPDGTQKCPRCGSTRIKYLEKARVWKCYGKDKCPKFSLKTGTIFQDSRISLDKWLPVVWLEVNSKKGVSSREIQRRMDVTQKTAWFMLHRVRLALQDGYIARLSDQVRHV